MNNRLLQEALGLSHYIANHFVHNCPADCEPNLHKRLSDLFARQKEGRAKEEMENKKEPEGEQQGE